MRPALRLLIVAAESAFLVVIGCLGVASIATKFFSQGHGPTIAQETILCLAFVILVGLATWLSLRTFRAHYSPREARALATAIAVSIPLSIAISMPLTQLFVISGNRYELVFTLILASGAMTTLLTCTALAVVLSIIHRIERVEQYK